MPGARNNINGNIYLQLALSGSQLIFSIISLPIAAKVIGPAGFGKIGIVESYVGFIVLLFSFGVPLIGVREIAVYSSDQTKLQYSFNRLFSIQFLAAIPATFLMLGLGLFEGLPGALICLGTLNVLFATLNIEWFLQGMERFKFIAIRSIIIRLLVLTGIILFIDGPEDLSLYYSLLVVNVIISFFLNFWYVQRHTTFSLTLIGWKQTIKKINILYACSLLIGVYTILDVILLNWLTAENEVGVYSFAYRLIRMATFVVLSAGILFTPKISKHFITGDKISLRRDTIVSQQVLYYISFPVCISTYTLAPEIVYILGAPAFDKAITCIRILAFVPLIVGLSHIATFQLMVPMHLEKLVLIVFITAAFMSIILNILLIPVLGIIGSSIANLFSELGVLLFSLSLLYRKKLFKLAAIPLMQSFFSALAVVPLAYIFRNSGMSEIWRLIGVVSLGCGFHFFIHHFFIPSSALHILPQKNGETNYF